MLAITGCGDDDSSNGGGAGSGGSAGSNGSAGSGGSAGSAGGSGGDFCDTLCQTCGGGQAECQQACDDGIGQIPGELEGCETELDAVGACLGPSDCTDSEACQAEWTAWVLCLVTPAL
jgi:hypothetical protein